MTATYMPLATQMRGATDAEETWQLCLEALGGFGVKWAGYAVIPLASEARQFGNHAAGYFKNNYPSEWFKVPGGDNALSEKRTVSLIRDGAPLVMWNDPEIYRDATPAQLRFRDHEVGLGMIYGVTIPLGRSPAGQTISGLGVCFSDVQSDAELAQIWARSADEISAIGYILDEKLRAPDAGLLPQLTARERDCLELLCQGMRPAEIAHALDLSEKTVEKYITGAKVKLNARTRDHAAVKAVILNLIQL